MSSSTASIRAKVAADSLLDRFWERSAGDFAGAYPPNGEPAGYWISAGALETLVTAAKRTGDVRYLEAARSFVAAQARRGFARDYFDDEAWMALALLHLYDLAGDGADLGRAAALAQDVFASAADDACCGTSPGGLWWDRAHSQKATAANAVPVMVAAGLYERTGEGRWLDLARSTYATWRGLMVSQSGQVADHLLPSGEKVLWSFTYNQGAMIGAALALREVTHDDAYLADARLYASFVLAGQTRPTPFGPVLFDGASCSGDCDAFKGIAHRTLSDLAAADGVVSGLDALLSADAEAAWSIARDPSSGTFGVDWGARPASPASLAAEVSAAAALEAEAARVGRAAGEARRASTDP